MKEKYLANRPIFIRPVTQSCNTAGNLPSITLVVLIAILIIFQLQHFHRLHKKRVLSLLDPRMSIAFMKWMSSQ